MPGYMGRGIALQIITSMPGSGWIAISNRNVAKAGLLMPTPVSTIRCVCRRRPSWSARLRPTDTP